MGTGSWPNAARAAITLTFDNMGEAADLNRNLWPLDNPIGNHYSVRRVLPKFLALAAKYDIHVTYFVEAWNLAVYPDAVKNIHDDGHEVAWHAWQHEAWGSECKEETAEHENFSRSFAQMRTFTGEMEKSQAKQDDEGHETVEQGEHVNWKGTGRDVPMYSGFRPPGGIIHGERTLRMCREFGLGYISPAAEHGALVPLGQDRENDSHDSIVVLPFRWRTVDAYYYMDAFAKLREIKGEFPPGAQPPSVLVQAFKRQVDEAIDAGGFVSFLFHPFLNDDEMKLQAMEEVLQYLAEKRDEGKIWLAPAKEVEAYVRLHPDVLGSDPGWDNTSWR